MNAERQIRGVEAGAGNFNAKAQSRRAAKMKSEVGGREFWFFAVFGGTTPPARQGGRK